MPDAPLAGESDIEAVALAPGGIEADDTGLKFADHPEGTVEDSANTDGAQLEPLVFVTVTLYVSPVAAAMATAGGCVTQAGVPALTV